MLQANPSVAESDAPAAGQNFYHAVQATLTRPVSDVTEADFAEPPQLCDIVMKGGITSGIVYPSAILRIAQQFRFKNIGGTSAGAIAATLLAAAEFRRTCQGSGGIGFMQLKTQIMQWLGEDKHLQSLFVPQAILAPLFFTLLWIIGLFSALRRFTIVGAFNLILTAVIGLLVLYGYLRMFFQVPWPFGDIPRIAAVVVTLLGIAALVCVMLIMPRTHFGLCTGGIAGTLRGLFHMKVEPLTFWLSRQIDSIANLPANRPLTFGDLWSGCPRAGNEPIPAKKDRVVNLEMITTCLTLGRPFRLPFEKDIFYYRSDELYGFLPAYVVNWMNAHQRAPSKSDPSAVQRNLYLKNLGYTPLPEAADFPIVLAARMSLSFPFLLSAMRLYAIDWTQPQTKTAPALEAAWFSDGGLSSNFPISLFDASLPQWPTLGITLEDFPPHDTRPVVMAANNNSMIGSTWSRFGGNPGFYGAIFNCMQNWRDNMQSEAPGFRDRIAHIRLSGTEGGLNLTMPPNVIATLLARGEDAGAQLVEHFALHPASAIQTNWNNHRWIRYRSTLAALEPYAQDFHAAWNSTLPWNVPAYATLGTTAHSYKFATGVATTAANVSNHMLDIANDTAPPNDSLTIRAPRPLTRLAARPEM